MIISNFPKYRMKNFIISNKNTRAESQGAPFAIFLQHHIFIICAIETHDYIQQLRDQ